MKFLYEDLLEIKSELVHEYCATEATKEQCDVYNQALTHFIDALDDQNQNINDILKCKRMKIGMLLSDIDERDYTIGTLNQKIEELNAQIQDLRHQLSDKLQLKEESKEVRRAVRRETLYKEIKRKYEKEVQRYKKLRISYDTILTRYCAAIQRLGEEVNAPKLPDEE